MKWGNIKDCLDNSQWCCLIICSVVLSIYYPTIFAETSKLDDQGMLTGILNAGPLDLKDLFFPRSHGAGYYRPLIYVSFYLDKFLWDLAPESMHFHNILLHLLISLQVMWLAKTLIRPAVNANYIAFFAALIFAVHPLATESVNWISGRTDLLAGCVMMTGVCLFFQPNVHHSLSGKAIALLLIAVSGLAKETTFVMFMALPLLHFGKNSGLLIPVVQRSEMFHRWFVITSLLMFSSALIFYNQWFVIAILICSFTYYLIRIDPDILNGKFGRSTAVFLLASLTSPAIFWGGRKLAVASDISKVAQTINLMFSDINYTIQLFSGSLVFYFKKAVFPLPLNLAIREIDPAYSLFGGILLLLLVLLFFYRSIFSGLILSGSFMLLPVLPLSFGTIAWTSHADRYVYLALPFWTIAATFFVSRTNIIGGNRLKILLFTIIFLVFSWSTFARNITWQTNVGIFADTVSKSPRFKMMRGLYMSTLYDEKRYNEAVEQYRVARTLSEVGYDDRIDLIYADILSSVGRDDESGWIYYMIYDNSHKKSVGALKGLINYNEKRLAEGRCSKAVCSERISAYTEVLATLSAGLYDDYELGKKYLRKGEIGKATALFSSLLANPNVDSSMRESVEKLMSRSSVK